MALNLLMQVIHETIMWKMIIDCKNDEIIDEFYRIMMRTTLGQVNKSGRIQRKN